MRSRPVIAAAIALGFALIIVAVVYWIEPAKSLPSFFPGHEAGSNHPHVKHGIASFLVGVACLIFAWFQTGPKTRAGRVGSARLTDQLPASRHRRPPARGGGLLVGLSHKDAARFALLATPIIGAAALLRILELLGPQGVGVRGQALVGALGAALTAWIAVLFLMRYFETRTLTPFAIYCLLAGAAATTHFLAT